MKTFFKLLLVAVFFVSCGEADTAIYKGESGQTLLAFSQGVYSLPIEINSVGSLDVTINSTTKSDTDRVFNVSVIAEETTADPATYNLPATVTIPAGSYQGVLRITGQDEGLEDSTVLVIKIANTDENVVFDVNKAIINVNQFCPVDPEWFVGDYLLEQQTAINPDDGTEVFSDQVVSISRIGDENSVTRSFEAIYLEGLDIGQPASTVNFQLLCGKVFVDSGINTFLRCGSSPTNITLGASTVPGTFDTADDSVFYLSLTEYQTDGGCGAAPYQVTFKLTKQ